MYPKDWEWAFSNYGSNELKSLLTTSALSVSAVFGGVLDRHQSVLIEAVRAADILGAQTVFAVAPVSGTVSLNECIDIVGSACDLLKPYGQTMAIHNHAGTFMESIRDSHKLCNSINRDNFGLCIDSLHFALFDDEIEKKLDPVLPYIKYVHLKDINKSPNEIASLVPKHTWKWGSLGFLEETYIDLEMGIIDNKAIAKRIKESGYSGWWLPEIERSRIDRLLHAKQNAEIVRRYLV